MRQHLSDSVRLLTHERVLRMRHMMWIHMPVLINQLDETKDLISNRPVLLRRDHCLMGEGYFVPRGHSS